MKNQIVIMRVASGILVDGPSLDKPIVFEQMVNLLSWLKMEINALPDVETDKPKFNVVE